MNKMEKAPDKMETKFEENIDKNDPADKMAKAIGEFGKWQILILIVASIPSKMSAIWQQISIIFLAPKTTFRCTDDTINETIFNSTCYENCRTYEYFSEFENNIISDWDLICGRAWLANFTQTVCMFGVLVGSAVYGFISDRYGRRPAIIMAAMTQMICGLMIPFSPDFWTFTVLRFVIGTSTAGLMVVSFVIVLEIVGPKKRELMTGLYQIPISFGEMVMPLYAYYLRDWDQFSLGIGITQCIFVIYLFVIPETPKWLISVGRLEEASEVMKRAAKINNLPTDNMLQIAKEISDDSIARQDKSASKASYLDLIRVPSLRIRNLCSCVCWFILGLSFYGGNQYIGQTSSNTFLTIVLAGSLQIPGLILSGFMYKRYGRKNTALGFCVLCAISNGLLVLPDEWFYVKLVAGATAVSCAAGGYSAMYTFTSELFPTVVRNMAVGASSTTSRVGSMLAPFVAGASGGPWVAPTIFAIAPLIAAVAVWFLPETKGKKLMDHLNEC
ncbi:organic cation transporter protein [Amyelois transitella]|uniref:organic cation transporter protein n=1 Tax=Amyelois transitella TaxID=680683 RepID=UPI00298FDDF3|nr:organic cation transporter protein [Amyelois transitella]XP_060806045.1 organic cation transporter protein [Amyelois transitella]